MITTICGTAMAALGLAQLCQAADSLDNWSRQGDGTSEDYRGVAYHDGRFVVVGFDTNNVGVIVTSSDGTNWTHVSAGTTNSLDDVCYGSGQFAAVGANGTVVVSRNGSEWIARDSGITNLLTGVAYGNGQFIATGFSYNGLASADGTNWTKFLLRPGPSLNKITFIGDQFVLPHYSAILASADGSDWSQLFRTFSGTSYEGIEYGNGRYVAVGSHGQVGGNGNVAISPDTRTWTALDVGQTNSLYAVAFGSGLFVAVGGLNGGSGGLILSSADGANWTHHPPGTRGWLADIAYGDGRFVAVGSFGTILLSQPVVQLEPLPPLVNGALQFKLSGPSGQTCAIHATTDFADWQVLTNLVLTNGSCQFIDRSAASFGRRFYRLATSP